jgi:predicted ATP-dependent protease
MGDGSVVDIEREVEMGGPTHSKGVLILQGLLTGRYARRQPFALSASLVFEQSYGGVEGDSASCAELLALVSSIAEVPLKQHIAITGSINQHGDIQAIGGVNEKIEGYFDVCNTRGLDGSHGVIIPASNVKDLMLRHDVVHAVKDGKFHVYPISNVDEGIEILTGMKAGAADTQGNYPKDTFNALVMQKISETVELRKRLSVPPPASN